MMGWDMIKQLLVSISSLFASSGVLFLLGFSSSTWRFLDNTAITWRDSFGLNISVVQKQWYFSPSTLSLMLCMMLAFELKNRIGGPCHTTCANSSAYFSTY
jgi:hypothetical protein